MKPSIILPANVTAIRDISAHFRADNPRVFGSVLHGTDTEVSDLDLLVDPQAETTLFDLGGLQMALEDLLGVRVDVKTPADLPARFRAKVLSEARPL